MTPKSPRSFPPGRLALTILLATGLLLSAGCAPAVNDPAAPSSTAAAETVEPDSVVGRIESGGSTLTLGGIEVTLPEDVAAVGTEVRLSLEEQTGVGDAAIAVSDGISIELGDGQQPSAPITLAFPIDADATDTGGSAANVFVRSTSGGEVDLHQGTYDPAAGNYTVEVDHLSLFQAWTFDLNKLFAEVRTAVLQGMGLEFPRPDCVGQAVEVGGKTYSLIQPPQSWVCLEGESTGLVARVYPNSGIPFVIESTGSAQAVTVPSDLTITGSSLVVIANALGFIDGNRAAVMPGTTAEMRFTGAPGSATLTLQQFPALLLMSILATTIDTALNVLGISFVLTDSLEGLDCLADVADIAGPGMGLNGETVGGIAAAFFDCVGPMMGEALGAKGAIILAIVGAAPGFLVSSVLGIINELTGLDKATVSLDVAMPAVPSEWLLTGNGVGPYRIGADAGELISSGLIVEAYCGPEPAPEWVDLGLLLDVGPDDRIFRLWVAHYGDDSRLGKLQTEAGIGLGSTLGSVRSAYPSLRRETRQGNGGDTPAWVVDIDGRELLLLTEGSTQDTAPVTMMILQETGLDIYGGC